jgi:putative FmdB family regulatory protein
MPYYDLKCADCGEEFNARASMAERADGAIDCPYCGSFRLETVFRRVNILRGRGDGPDACPMREGGGCAGGCGCAQR